MRWPRASVVLMTPTAFVLLSGCTLFGGEPVTVPVTDLRGIESIKWECDGANAAKGTARKGVLAVNSILASHQAKKDVVYGDHCPAPKPAPKPAAKQEPKVS